MASVLISSILKATTDWLSLIRRTPTASLTTPNTVADDLEKLERMLERIKAVLVDAEERQIVDRSVKLWLKEIKDVAYDAEDVLDEYLYNVLRVHVENRAIATAREGSMKMKGVEGEEEVMSSASADSNIAAIKLSLLNNMANRIKNIRKRFKEISKDRDRLHLKSEDGERRRDSISECPPPTTQMIIEHEIYGRVDEKEELIDWLFSNSESKFEVLAVVGKGGLGKTTLAQLVYNDQKVSDYFETRTWICVSDDFNLTRLTRTMIESITRQSYTFSELSLLQEFLHRELQGKRVLLVLDDVWNDKKGLWETLSIPLHGAEMARIIVTTRIDSVAEIMQTMKPYRLGYLPEDQCWQLFLCRAFCGRDPEQFPSLVEIGKKIVRKCDGLPLAVKSLGSLLQHEIDEDKWNEVLHSKLWDNETDILPALMLSYIRMPSHLKPCFEICSMLPKDYDFNKDELVNLWAANGYIQNNVERDVKEIGYMNFNELHRRSFFDKLSGSYRMHDNIHDLAQYIQVGMDLGNHRKQKIRHLSIENETLEFYLDDIGALRNLIVPRENNVDINGMLRRNITRLTSLRYLEIRHYRFGEKFLLPDGFRSLICLRHLKFDIANNMDLTKSIANLYKLVVLDITCHGLVKLPKTLSNLVSLTTIHFCGFYNVQLPALGQIPSLKYLILKDLHNIKSIGNEFYRGQNNCHQVAFPALTSLAFNYLPKWRKWDEFQQGDFPQLRKLKISRCEHLSVPSLRNLGSLSDISIHDCGSLQLSSKGSFPPNLKTLENIHGSAISLHQGFGGQKKLESLSGIFEVGIDDVFEILKNLVSLKYLILSSSHIVGFESRGGKKICILL